MEESAAATVHLAELISEGGVELPSDAMEPAPVASAVLFHLPDALAKEVRRLSEGTGDKATTFARDWTEISVSQEGVVEEPLFAYTGPTDDVSTGVISSKDMRFMSPEGVPVEPSEELCNVVSPEFDAHYGINAGGDTDDEDYSHVMHVNPTSLTAEQMSSGAGAAGNATGTAGVGRSPRAGNSGNEIPAIGKDYSGKRAAASPVRSSSATPSSGAAGRSLSGSPSMHRTSPSSAAKRHSISGSPRGKNPWAQEADTRYHRNRDSILYAPVDTRLSVVYEAADGSGSEDDGDNAEGGFSRKNTKRRRTMVLTDAPVAGACASMDGARVKARRRNSTPPRQSKLLSVDTDLNKSGNQRKRSSLPLPGAVVDVEPIAGEARRSRRASTDSVPEDLSIGSASKARVGLAKHASSGGVAIEPAVAGPVSRRSRNSRGSLQ